MSYRESARGGGGMSRRHLDEPARVTIRKLTTNRASSPREAQRLNTSCAINAEAILKTNKSRVPHSPVERSKFQGEGNEGNVLQRSREALRGVGAPAGCERDSANSGCSEVAFVRRDSWHPTADEGDAGLCRAAWAATWALPPFSAAPTPDARAWPAPRAPLEPRPLEGARAVQAASPAAPRRPAPRRAHSPQQTGERVAGRAQAAAPRAAAAAGTAAAAAAEAGGEPLPGQQLLHGREVPGAGRLQQLLLLPHPQGRRSSDPHPGPRRACCGSQTFRLRATHPSNRPVTPPPSPSPASWAFPPPASRHFRDPASRVTAPPRPRAPPPCPPSGRGSGRRAGNWGERSPAEMGSTPSVPAHSTGRRQHARRTARSILTCSPSQRFGPRATGNMTICSGTVEVREIWQHAPVFPITFKTHRLNTE